MKKVESIAQLQQFQSNVRAKHKRFLTNFYFDEFKHSIWIGKGSLYYEWISDTCFLFRKTNNFWNTYYISPSLDELSESLKEVKCEYNENSLIFDIVGRREQCDVLIPIFIQNGYVEESSLVRFIRINTPIEYGDELALVTRADLEQTHLVHGYLHQYMNERVEMIPDIEEYEHWGELGHILIFQLDGEIAGFFDYEKNSSTMIPRHWLVLPNYRGKHIGSILYHRLLYEANDTKRILSWVIQTNERSIQSHFHYGFKMENMYDYIMSNVKII